ncbi:hypothetical protein Barb6_02380 [Bacteroidales bacterium Barb6]|nr:hypothetical protein Barb6_02380 [Bacteroidales bacterium Barb6]
MQHPVRIIRSRIRTGKGLVRHLSPCKVCLVVHKSRLRDGKDKQTLSGSRYVQPVSRRPARKMETRIRRSREKHLLPEVIVSSSARCMSPLCFINGHKILVRGKPRMKIHIPLHDKRIRISR